MNDMERALLPRCLVVWLTTTAGAAGLSAWLLRQLAPALDVVREHPGAAVADQSFDRLLVWLCAAAALVCIGWLWTVVTAVSAQAACGLGGRALPWVPPAVRRAVLAACGIALVTGLATPALATPGPVHLDRTGRIGPAALEGLPLPDRATGSGTARARLQEGPASQPGEQGRPGGTGESPGSGGATPARVEVHAGDSLWSIAVTVLPAGADPATVDTEWRLIHDLNRDVVGADPDLIQPGQRLRLPPT